MSIQIIEARIRSYSPQSKQEEINAFKEIVQSIALSGLSRGGFFKIAAFQGGTCLRICHSLQRFSEDMDFILLKPNKTFTWEPFFKYLQLEFEAYGLELTVQDRSKADQPIKKAFLKDTSFGKILSLIYDRSPSDQQVATIKLEIDSNPPPVSSFETNFLDFPLPFSIVSQDLPSLFASKCHALLCRPYVKGRDWFDFLWYVSTKISLNYGHLEEALKQTGPWQGKEIALTKKWIYSHFAEKINSLDWEKTKKDVENFLKPRDRESLHVWNKELFLATLEKMNSSLPER